MSACQAKTDHDFIWQNNKRESNGSLDPNTQSEYFTEQICVYGFRFIFIYKLVDYKSLGVMKSFVYLKSSLIDMRVSEV